ncbi:hypothetical protein MSAN_02094000 [Mycena sanguinolenta]|uniref:Uncharacterized protein n=1 Tax=Mycena sanguinolenta TaxID=230812 RepID=A0A8H7CKI1_9AGAR|nr:hypothetical protein MSAN_02094000 [Mycena sanguinolenta]
MYAPPSPSTSPPTRRVNGVLHAPFTLLADASPPFLLAVVAPGATGLCSRSPSIDSLCSLNEFPRSSRRCFSRRRCARRRRLSFWNALLFPTALGIPMLPSAPLDSRPPPPFPTQRHAPCATRPFDAGIHGPTT